MTTIRIVPPKYVDYKIVTVCKKCAYEEFIKTVKEALLEGWEPTGPYQFYFNDVNSVEKYTQAMCLRNCHYNSSKKSF